MKVPLLAAVLALSPSAQQEAGVPPEVGEIAPPLGAVHWQQLEEVDGGRPPSIADQRGRVVVVHTYGHYCDP